MPREYVKPETRPASSPTHDTVETHPAYGMIGASRVSGQAILNGSDFVHQHFVTIRVRHSSLHRGHSRDSHYGGNEIVEVALSEAQWAAFVSSMNVGDGVPCTIESIQGQEVPGIPRVKNRREQFTGEHDAAMAGALEHLDRATAILAKGRGKMTAADFESLKSALHMGRMGIDENKSFIADQFSEHMEKTTERAKIEVNAYVQATLVRAGIQALQAPVQVQGILEAGDEAK